MQIIEKEYYTQIDLSFLKQILSKRHVISINKEMLLDWKLFVSELSVFRNVTVSETKHDHQVTFTCLQCIYSPYAYKLL